MGFGSKRAKTGEASPPAAALNKGAAAEEPIIDERIVPIVDPEPDEEAPAEEAPTTKTKAKKEKKPKTPKEPKLPKEKKGKKGAAEERAIDPTTPGDPELVDDDVLANDPAYAAAYAAIQQRQSGGDEPATPPITPGISNFEQALRRWAPTNRLVMCANQPLLLLEDQAGRAEGWEGSTQFGRVPKGSKDGRSVHLLLERKVAEPGGDEAAKRKSRASNAKKLKKHVPRIPEDKEFTYDGVSQVVTPWEPKSLSKVAAQVRKGAEK